MTAPAPLLAAANAALVVAIPMALLVAPPDAVQGDAQRFMYLHVPAAWCAYLCFATVLVGSVWFLATRSERAAAYARAAAESGVVLTALTLLTGTVWGVLTWGTWWAWDARIATTTAMGLVYVVYLALLHVGAGIGARRAAAVVGIAGFAVVPVVHFSVVWWRTLHQPPTVLAPESGLPIDPVMGVTLAAAMVAMTLVTAVIVIVRARRVRTERVREPLPGRVAEPAAP